MISLLLLEILKLRRSRTVWIVSGVMALVPVLVTATLLGSQASLSANTGVSRDMLLQLRNPDWQFFLRLNGETLNRGPGLMLFSFAAAHIFAREYREHTYALMLTLPTARWRIVAAKFGALLVWMTALGILQVGVSLALGLPLGLGRLAPSTAVNAVVAVLITTWLYFLAMPLTSWLATVSRGYFAPIALATGALVIGVPVSAVDLTAWLPWSIPELYIGSGNGGAPLRGASVAVLVATFLVGVTATVLQYRRADAPL